MEKKLSNLITKEDVIEILSSSEEELEIDNKTNGKNDVIEILSSSEEELEINKTHEKLHNEKITIGNVGTTTTRIENNKGNSNNSNEEKGKCN